MLVFYVRVESGITQIRFTACAYVVTLCGLVSSSSFALVFLNRRVLVAFIV
jgi:hypothetical protein